MNERVQSLSVLVVSNLAKSQNFYSEVYGCEVTDWWALRNDEVKLGFKLIQAQDERMVNPNSQPDVCDVYGYADDFESLELLFEEWKQKGVTVVKKPESQQMDWGTWREFFVQDPDGYVLGIGSAHHGK